MKTIKITHRTLYAGPEGTFHPGATSEQPEDTAKALINGGYAARYVETAALNVKKAAETRKKTEKQVKKPENQPETSADNDENSENTGENAGEAQENTVENMPGMVDPGTDEDPFISGDQAETAENKGL